MSVRSGMAGCPVALGALCLRIAPPESLDVTKPAHALVTLARPRRTVPVTASMALRGVPGGHGDGLLAGSVSTEAHEQTSPESMVIWNSWFAGQFPDQPAVPALAPSQEYDLEGHTVLFRRIGGADGVLATIVHVPELAAVCSGDIVYNSIHMWLWHSTPESRAGWLASLDAVAALKPATIITGHKDPGAPDDDAVRVLDQSRRYIEDFESAVAKVGWPGGIAPPGSHRSGRDSLPSSGSCHPGHQE
jgi:hypothetical protein